MGIRKQEHQGRKAPNALWPSVATFQARGVAFRYELYATMRFYGIPDCEKRVDVICHATRAQDLQKGGNREYLLGSFIVSERILFNLKQRREKGPKEREAAQNAWQYWISCCASNFVFDIMSCLYLYGSYVDKLFFGLLAGDLWHHRRQNRHP